MCVCPDFFLDLIKDSFLDDDWYFGLVLVFFCAYYFALASFEFFFELVGSCVDSVFEDLFN